MKTRSSAVCSNQYFASTTRQLISPATAFKSLEDNSQANTKMERLKVGEKELGRTKEKAKTQEVLEGFKDYKTYHIDSVTNLKAHSRQN